jgi:hypothetical protein
MESSSQPLVCEGMKDGPSTNRDDVDDSPFNHALAIENHSKYVHLPFYDDYWDTISSALRLIMNSKELSIENLQVFLIFNT